MRKAIREGVLNEIDLEDAQCRDNEIPDYAFIFLRDDGKDESAESFQDDGNEKPANDEQNYLRRITCPSGIERIGAYAFAGTGIKKIDLPENVSDLGMCCFLGSNLRSLTIGSQIRVIPEHAFQECWNLREVRLLEPVGFLQPYSFSRLNLTKIELPSTFFAEGFAFQMTKVEEVIFNSQTVKEVDVRNPKLGEVVFNEGVETVAERLFSGCRALSVIIFPSTLLSVGEGCFADNPALQKVYCRNAVPPIAEADTFCGTDGIVPS